MTAEKAREIIRIYREALKIFVSFELVARRFDDSTWGPSRTNAFEHCLVMLRDAESLLSRGSIAEAFSLLKFVQGVLWALGIYTLGELEEHNK